MCVFKDYGLNSILILIDVVLLFLWRTWKCMRIEDSCFHLLHLRILQILLFGNGRWLQGRLLVLLMPLLFPGLMGHHLHLRRFLSKFNIFSISIICSFLGCRILVASVCCFLANIFCNVGKLTGEIIWINMFSRYIVYCYYAWLDY